MTGRPPSRPLRAEHAALVAEVVGPAKRALDRLMAIGDPSIIGVPEHSHNGLRCRSTTSGATFAAPRGAL
jgi:hypothetical protein